MVMTVDHFRLADSERIIILGGNPALTTLPQYGHFSLRKAEINDDFGSENVYRPADFKSKKTRLWRSIRHVSKKESTPANVYPPKIVTHSVAINLCV